MGRYARINRPDINYHVINRGNNRQVIFAEYEDYQFYLNTIRRYKKKYKFKLFAYCLMTNHVHMLIKTSEAGSISKIMQCITVAYIRYFNYKYRRSGHIWQGRFMSPVVSEDEHLLNVMRYIEQNPLRAGMVRDIIEYAWSSYCLNIRNKESVLIDRQDNVAFNQLGKNNRARINKYKEFLTENINEKQLRELHKSTRKGSDYLSNKFKEQIAFMLPRKRERGRPRSRNLVVRD